MPYCTDHYYNNNNSDNDDNDIMMMITGRMTITIRTKTRQKPWQCGTMLFTASDPN